MQGLALTRSLIRLEAAVNAALAMAKDNPPAALDSLKRLRGDINDQVATPLAHALRMAGGQFNELSIKGRKWIVKSVCNPQLSRWLEDAEDSLTDLSSGNMSPQEPGGQMGCFRSLAKWFLLQPRPPPPPGRAGPATSPLPTRADAQNHMPPAGPFTGGASSKPLARGTSSAQLHAPSSPLPPTMVVTGPSVPQAIKCFASKQLPPPR